MSIPYVGNALNGWVKPQTVYSVKKTVIDGLVKEQAVKSVKRMNLQPMPKERHKDMPAEQRSWSWWSILIKEADVSFGMDDLIWVTYRGKLRGYRIKERQNWGAAGFCRYAAIEDFVDMPEVVDAA